MPPKPELPIIQRTYDFVLWLVPLVNRWPRDHKFGLGDRVIDRVYHVMEELVGCRYDPGRLPRLVILNTELDVLRMQMKLALDLKLFGASRFECAALQLQSIGAELGNWIKQQKGSKPA